MRKKEVKSLVIYYSKTGNTKLMAESIASEVNADLFEIQRQKDIKSSGFMLYFRGGFESMTRKNIRLEKTEIDLEKYDLIFLGTPVWAWRLNPVVRSFLKKVKIENKKIGLFASCAGSAEGVLADLKDILKKNTILGESEYVEPLKKNTEALVKKAKTWAKEIQHKAGK
ncbi:MAG: flavodoxin [Candidatus Heimdallarchaeota archaeon]|nr:flavodoxin [Candidatus Heimdallarchaeota archaeon]MBY8995012.1 flavodoxin [Candidatus Heimdallarchaeota archaeon]